MVVGVYSKKKFSYLIMFDNPICRGGVNLNEFQTAIWMQELVALNKIMTSNNLTYICQELI